MSKLDKKADIRYSRMLNVLLHSTTLPMRLLRILMLSAAGYALLHLWLGNASDLPWQQFTGIGIVGRHAGAQLKTWPIQIVAFNDVLEM